VSEVKQEFPSISKPRDASDKPDDILFKTSEAEPKLHTHYEAKDLGDEIRNFTDELYGSEEEKPFTYERCGTISRFIITAWAHQVKIVVWKQDEMTEGLKRDEDPYLMPSLDSFPDTSALGGA
jgi:hypothetical protein